MNILDKILEEKKKEVSLLKNKYSLSSFRSMDLFGRQNLSLIKKLNDKSHVSIIAEIKKVSPSKGVLKKDFDHLDIAKSYIKNGANAISVLTDEKFFQGKIQFLSDISKISPIPLLRKDFIIDEYQVFEAKAFGADVILLISEALTREQINDLTKSAKEIGLEVLLEVHSPTQLDKIDFNLNKIIGINNRDLNTFVVDLNTTKEIIKHLPNGTKAVSESGISKQNDIDFIKSMNINGILVGEHLMKSENLDNSFSQLKKWCTIEG